MPAQHGKVARGLRLYILHVAEQMKKVGQSSVVVTTLKEVCIALERLPAAPAVEDLHRCAMTLRRLSEESPDHQLRHLVGDCVLRLETFIHETLGPQRRVRNEPS